MMMVTYRVMLVMVRLEVGGEHCVTAVGVAGHRGCGAGEGGREVRRLEIHGEVRGRRLGLTGDKGHNTEHRDPGLAESEIASRLRRKSWMLDPGPGDVGAQHQQAGQGSSCTLMTAGGYNGPITGRTEELAAMSAPGSGRAGPASISPGSGCISHL